MRKYLYFIRGAKKWQKIFEYLYSVTLSGMNYSNANMNLNGERKVLINLRNSLSTSQPVVFFDIGANIGNYSKMIKEVFSEYTITIHAFEPSVNTFKILNKNLSGTKGIIYNNHGLGDCKQTLKLYSSQQQIGLSSLYERELDYLGLNLDEIEEISVITLDDYCKENDIHYIDFMKIDVEGHELKVLEGASRLLHSGKIAHIQFEFGGCNIDSRTYFKDFWKALAPKYNIYRILKDGLWPIDAYHEKLEIFSTINFLAVLKS